MVPGGRQADQGQHMQTEERVALAPPMAHTVGMGSAGVGAGGRGYREAGPTQWAHVSERCCVIKGTSHPFSGPLEGPPETGRWHSS